MPRIHPADEQASYDLATTEQNGHKLRAGDLLFVLLLAGFLLGFGIAIFLLPQKTFSEQENRSLQTLPDLSVDAFMDDEFSQKIADFYADQFPARTGFVGLKALSEITLLRLENNGCLIGKNGYLIKRLEYTEDGYENIHQNLAAIAVFSQAVGENHIPVTLAIAPRGIDVLTAYLPNGYHTDRVDAAWEQTMEITVQLGITPVTFTDELRRKATNGIEVWFRTDHHWTPRGAYLAYRLLAESLDYSPLPMTSLTEETASTAFYGTTYSSAGIPWAQPDTLIFYHIPNEEHYVCEIVDTGKTFCGFYDRSYLDTKDKYSALISGNHGYIRITDTENPDKPTLLVVKDSFAHAMIPYLAEHFNLEILDLRYFRDSTASLLAKVKADHVLILAGLDSFSTAKTFERLKFGLSSSFAAE